MAFLLGKSPIFQVYYLRIKKTNKGQKNWGSKDLAKTKVFRKHSSFFGLCQFLSKV